MTLMEGSFWERKIPRLEEMDFGGGFKGTGRNCTWKIILIRIDNDQGSQIGGYLVFSSFTF
jgi:hypothetical protein